MKGKFLSRFILIAFTYFFGIAFILPAQASEVKLADNYSEKAFMDFVVQLDLANKSTANNNIIFDLSPSLTPQQKKMITEDVKISGKFWSSQLNDIKILVLGSTTQDFPTLAGKLNGILTPLSLSGGWVEKKGEIAAREPNSFNGGMAAGYSKTGQSVIGVYLPLNQNLYNGGILQITSHEFTHIVQREILQGNMSPMQCWVREGQAQYIGWHMSGRNSKAAFANYWVEMLSMLNAEMGYRDVTNFTAEDFTQWFIDNKLRSMVRDCDGIENYIYGALGYEVLYGSYGSKAVDKYFANLLLAKESCADGSNQTIPACREATGEAFSKAFGISEGEFYKLAGEHIFQTFLWASKMPRFSETAAPKIAGLPFEQPSLSVNSASLLIATPTITQTIPAKVKTTTGKSTPTIKVSAAPKVEKIITRYYFGNKFGSLSN